MTRDRTLLRLTLVAVCWGALVADARAIEIAGAWVTDASHCNAIFVKGRTGVSFAKGGDVYGGGLIIDRDRLKTRMAKCRIKTRNEDGSAIHLVASCASDIMLSDVQLSLKVIDQNKLTRVFPGIAGVEMTYERCELQ